MSRPRLRIVLGMFGAIRFWRWLNDKEGNAEKPDFAGMAGAGASTVFVISQSKGLTMEELFNLVGSNLELLVVAGALLGMLLPKLSVWTYKGIMALAKGMWFGLKASGCGVTSVFTARPRRRLRTSNIDLLPENVRIKTQEQGRFTRVTVAGPAGKVSDSFKGSRRYAKRLNKMSEKLAGRYIAMHDVVTMGNTNVWNPTRNWKDVRGRVLELSEMDTSHLRNVINVCKTGRSDLGSRVLDEFLPRAVKELNRREQDLYDDRYDVIEVDAVIE